MEIAVFVDANAIDVLHHDVAETCSGDAQVEHTDDAGVIQRSQYTTLVLNRGFCGRRKEMRMQDLDGHLLRELLHALSQVDGAHTAFAEQPQDAKRAYRVRHPGNERSRRLHLFDRCVEVDLSINAAKPKCAEGGKNNSDRRALEK